MPLMQDRSLDLLTSSPARYHCTTDAPTIIVNTKRTTTTTTTTAGAGALEHRQKCFV